jgi:hypothetical protein
MLLDDVLMVITLAGVFLAVAYILTDLRYGPSSWAHDSGSTPRARTLPNKAAERLIEMRLIRQPTVDRDLGERQVGLQHQALRALNSPPHHISVRWIIEALSKSSAEMGHALFRHPSQIHRMDCRVQVRLDIG